VKNLLLTIDDENEVLVIEFFGGTPRIFYKYESKRIIHHQLK